MTKSVATEAAAWICEPSKRFRIEPNDCPRGTERYAATLEEAREIAFEILAEQSPPAVGIWDASIIDHPAAEDAPMWAQLEEWTLGEAFFTLRQRLAVDEGSANAGREECLELLMRLRFSDPDTYAHVMSLLKLLASSNEANR